MNKEWYKNWFSSEDYLDVYRHRNANDTENLVNLILSSIDINNSDSILDAACGAGRHSIKFAEKGFQVTGFDLSETLLDIAVFESSKRDLQINFQNSDLRHFYSKEKFDLVLSLFTSFGYFNSDEENFLFVQNAYEMLNKNGYYVLDYLNQEFLKENLVNKTEKIVDGKEILENRYISDGRVNKKITIKKGNEISEYLESVKLYSYSELAEKFGDLGFKVVKVFGDYLGHNYQNESSERCIIIFQK
jgi:2-polyprenyl-3-methyl-5-hydroxy-6-metoxy-1,4-benzoquinol methylase